MKSRFLEGKTALVTGSVQGIGLAIAKALASAGARIAVHGLATPEEAAAAVSEIHAAGALDAHFFDADMLDPDAIERMMTAVDEWGGADILVNNAGIQRTVSLAEADREIWDTILAINLSGAFHTMRQALPKMAERGYGRVVNIASVHGLVASVNKAPYVASKFGLIGLSRVAALEYATAGSRDSAASPSTASAPAGPRPRSSSRRFRRALRRSASAAMPASPTCWPRSSRAGVSRGRKKSARRCCGWRVPLRTILPASRSPSTAAGPRNRWRP